MLILTRYPGQSVIIDEKTTVTVLNSPKGGNVRLGFEAPEETHIVREELKDQYTKEARLSCKEKGNE